MKKFMELSNNEDACVISATLKSEAYQIISSVSHNFSKIFGMNRNEVLQKPITNLMAVPYAKIH